jgi:hypothetical protein
LPETLTTLVDFPRRMGIDLCGSSVTLDAGFDSQDKKDAIKTHKMKPVISPNRRNTKTPIAIAQKFRWFDRALYRLRYNPTATSIFDMRATTQYVPPTYLVYPQEATYVTSLPDQWGRSYHSHL